MLPTKRPATSPAARISAVEAALAYRPQGNGRKRCRIYNVNDEGENKEQSTKAPVNVTRISRRLQAL